MDFATEGAALGRLAAIPTAIVSRPRPSMASRAFTAMLMMAVSNWPASALTKHGSSGAEDDDFDARTDQGADHFASVCTLRPTSNTSGFNVCRRAKASNCPVSLAARVTVSEIASI